MDRSEHNPDIKRAKEAQRHSHIMRSILDGMLQAYLILLTVLRVVPAAAIAANVLYFFSDLTVDRKRHVVVVVRVLAVPLLVAQRHYFDQAERFFLGFLHRHGRVFSARRGEPGAAHDGGRGVHRRVIDRFEHEGGRENGAVLLRCGFKLKGHQSSSYPNLQQQIVSSTNRPLLSVLFPHLLPEIPKMRNGKKSQLLKKGERGKKETADGSKEANNTLQDGW